MDDDVFFGIDNAGIDSLCLEIMEYSDNIAEILEKIDNCFYQISDYYKATSYEKILLKYEVFRKNYALIKKNVASYSEDYEMLSRKIKDGSKRISIKVIADSSDLNQKKHNIIK